jgi:hypothetical protein
LHRWHLNLQSEFGFICDLEDLKMHKLSTDGCWYSMDAGKKHTASNFGSIDRVQLVVRQLLSKNQLVDAVPVKIVMKVNSVDFRYQFDNTISSWLNTANKNSIINNFKFVNDTVSFNVERNNLESLKSVVPNIFEILE